MYTGDGTWYRTVRIKFPVARLFALAENVGLTMSNVGRGLFTVQHPPYTVLYSTVNVFLLFCMMCSTVLYLVYSSIVLYCSVKSVHSKRPVLQKTAKTGDGNPVPRFSTSTGSTIPSSFFRKKRDF